MSKQQEYDPGSFTDGDKANQAFMAECQRLAAAELETPVTALEDPKKPKLSLDRLIKLFSPYRSRLIIAGASGILALGTILFPGGAKEAIAGDSQAGYTVVKGDDWNNPPAYSAKEARFGWISPTIVDKSKVCSTSIWTGIGSYGQAVIAQAGEVFEVSSGKVIHTAFTEAYPDELSPKSLAVTIHGGDTVGALVRRNDDGTFTMGIKDFTTGKVASRIRSQSANKANVVEDRIERTPAGSTNNLCNFGTLKVKYADATISGFKGPLDSLGWLVNRENMDVGTNILATTSSLTRVTLSGNQGSSWNFQFVAPS